MEDQLSLLRKQIHMVCKDLEELAYNINDVRIHDICQR